MTGLRVTAFPINSKSVLTLYFPTPFLSLFFRVELHRLREKKLKDLGHTIRGKTPVLAHFNVKSSVNTIIRSLLFYNTHFFLDLDRANDIKHL